MSNELPALDESLFEWETAKSKNGASFRIGREKSDGVKGDHIKEVTKAAEVAAGKENFGIDVNWPVDGYWTTTTDDVKNIAAITQYKLWKCNSGWGDYCLQFTNEQSSSRLYIHDAF